jgi:hypothetical protein
VWNDAKAAGSHVAAIWPQVTMKYDRSGATELKTKQPAPDRVLEFKGLIFEKQPPSQAAVLLAEAGRLAVDHYLKKV